MSNWVDVLSAIYSYLTSSLEFDESSGTLTTDGTEQTLVTVDAPARLIIPSMVLLDTTNNVDGDQVVVRSYYRIKSGGGYVVESSLTISGVQSPPLKTFSLNPSLYGFKVTVEKVSGANHDYDWEAIIAQ
jgi:hypothetical protein